MVNAYRFKISKSYFDDSSYVFKDEIKLIKDLRGIQADWQEVDYSKWSRLLLFDAKAYFESLRPA